MMKNKKTENLDKKDVRDFKTLAFTCMVAALFIALVEVTTPSLYPLALAFLAYLMGIIMFFVYTKAQKSLRLEHGKK